MVKATKRSFFIENAFMFQNLSTDENPLEKGYVRGKDSFANIFLIIGKARGNMWC